MRPGHAVFIVVFIAAFIGLGVPFSRQAQAPAPLGAEAKPARIEVRRPREDLILTREASGPWVVAKLDDVADPEAVELLLSGLRSLSFGPPVAPPEAGLASGLGPADSARVRILDEAGRTLFDGLFGRRLFGRSAYFRADDRDAIRVATGVDPDLLLRTSAQWRAPRPGPKRPAADLIGSHP